MTLNGIFSHDSYMLTNLPNKKVRGFSLQIVEGTFIGDKGVFFVLTI